jgi:hypothetical protein
MLPTRGASFAQNIFAYWHTWHASEASRSAAGVASDRCIMVLVSGVIASRSAYKPDAITEHNALILAAAAQLYNRHDEGLCRQACQQAV